MCTLLDTAGLLTQVAVGQIQTHDFKLCGPLLRSSPVLCPGDLLLEDRGLLDGATITQAIAFEQMKTRRTHVIVYAGGYVEIFETLSFVHLALVLSPAVQTRLRQWLEEHLPQLAKRE